MINYYLHTESYKAFLYSVKKFRKTGKVDTQELFAYLKDKYGEHLNLVLQGKYDGMKVGISKIKDDITVVSKYGSDLTNQIPKRVIDSIKQVKNDFVAQGELELYINGKHQPRGVTIGLIHRHHRKYNPQYNFCITLFDLVNLDGRDVTKMSTLNRVKLLHTIKGVPSLLTPKSISLNIAPYAHITTFQQLQQEINKYCKINHFEGVILKDAEAPLSKLILIKYKKYMEIVVVVLKVIPTKTEGVYNYYVGVLNKSKVIPVGKTYNSSIKLKAGDKAVVSFFDVAAYYDSTHKLQRVRLYGARIQEKTFASVTTLPLLLYTANYYGILEKHYLR